VSPEAYAAHRPRLGYTEIPGISPAAEGRKRPDVKADMIDDTRMGPMQGVWLTELLRHHLPDLSGLRCRHPSDVSLGLGGRWHVSHMGNSRLVTRRHEIAVILNATEPGVGVGEPPQRRGVRPCREPHCPTARAAL
jgi:hypothetical protein